MHQVQHKQVYQAEITVMLCICEPEDFCVPKKAHAA